MCTLATRAKSIEELRFRFYKQPEGTEIEADDRMKAFAIKYAQRFQKQCGSLPHGGHPIPNPWDYTLVIEFSGPGQDAESGDPA